MNTLQDYEKNHLKELSSGKSIPKFNPGDTLKVHLKVKEGEKERIQIFEGVCIGLKNSGLNSSFTVRKISYGEGIERVLPLYSPQISKIELVKSGDVRRSKLYFLRNRSGKSARISEKGITKSEKDFAEPSENQDNKSSEEKKSDSHVKVKADGDSPNLDQTQTESKKNEEVKDNEKK